MKSQRYSGRPRKLNPILFRRVVGKSMLPTLRPGRIIIASSIFFNLNCEDVVIVHHYGLEKVKRIQNIKDGRVFVVGDNASHSTDSVSFGWLDKSTVMAKVVWPRV